MRIVLVRHGETEANVTRRWQGRTDAPLTARGLAQARALGTRLSVMTFDRVVASDLGRATATAEALAFAARAAGGELTPGGARCAHDPTWRECDVGAWEGLTRDEVAARFPDQWRALVDGRRDVALGGGESLGAFWGRVDAALDALVAELGEAGTALVVTHGGVIAAIVARLLGTRDARPSTRLGRIANTSLTVVTRDARGLLGLARLNDHLHLPPDEVGADDRAAVTCDGALAPLHALHAAASPAALAAGLTRHAAWWRPATAVHGEDPTLLDAARDALGPSVDLRLLPEDETEIVDVLRTRDQPAAIAAAPTRVRRLAARFAGVRISDADALLTPASGAVSHAVRAGRGLTLVDHAAFVGPGLGARSAGAEAFADDPLLGSQPLRDAAHPR
jgi:broad specificity phosphatase PhoE